MTVCAARARETYFDVMSPSVNIRSATIADADEICAAHIASIRGVCAKDYPPHVIDAWVDGKVSDLYVKSLAEGNAIFVAEREGRILGFIEILFSSGYIRAFYLLPEAIGQGVGTMLLNRAEEAFLSRGIENVDLNSTLTSVGFYESQGYKNHGPTTHRLSSGVEIACVKMGKRLSLSLRERAGVRERNPLTVQPQPNAPSPQPRHWCPPEGSGGLRVIDLGLVPYRDAWKIQEETHERVHAGEAETILIVEHPPVITMGRRGESQGMPNLIASKELLEANHVELVQTDRGGDITFHGPGQIVVYPIIRLHDHKRTVGGYVHSLERAVIEALASFGIASTADPSAVGVWTNDAKIAAIGVRIRKGVSLHGIALNVSTDLKFFDLIIPCGLQGRPVTSMERIMGPACPMMEIVKQAIVNAIVKQVLK